MVRFQHFFLVAFVVWLCAVPRCLYAEPQTQTLTHELLSGTALGTTVEILEDVSGVMSLQNILAAPETRWKRSETATPSFGFTSSAYWVRFSVVNRQAQPIDWLLEVGYPMIDSVTIFIPESGVYVRKLTGDHFLFSHREIDYRNCIITLTEKPGTERTYYLRFRTTSSMNISLVAWSPSAFTQFLSREQIIIGLYYGAMVVMLLYNLFLFLGIRDVNYLYYVLFIAGQIMYQFTLNGLAFQYLWGGAIWWGNICLPVFMGFATFWAMFFARSFLGSKTNTPVFDRIYLVILPCIAVSAILALVLPYSWSIRVMTFLAMIGAPCLMINAAMEWRNGFAPAKYFFISWVAFITGVILYTLKTFGVLPSNAFTNLTIQIGSLLQIVLLSLALVGKFNVMRREHYKTQQELVKAQITTFEAERARQDAEIYRLRNVELAQAYREVESQKNAVEAQKAEMETLNESLRELNNEKNEFLGIVAHDLKNPLSNISMLAKVLRQGAQNLKPEEIEEFSGDIQTASGRMFDLITNLLDVNAIENKAVRLTPIPFDLTEVAQYVVTDYRGRAEAKQISMRFEIPPDNTMVFADKSSTLQILDNLVSNAIKYSPPEKHIFLRVSKHENAVHFEVQDEGQGLTPEDKQKLFGKFARLSAQPTGGEHSTGLGLSIARKLAQAMNGDIWCESDFGQGAKFVVKLPAISVVYSEGTE